MVGVPNLTEMDERVDCGEESSVEPSATLRYKFGYRVYLMLAREVHGGVSSGTNLAHLSRPYSS